MPFGEAFDRVLAAAAVGAEWAWRELYRQDFAHGPRLRPGPGAADPDDAVGETFCKVVCGLASFSGDERAFRAWVLAIARHQLIDQARRGARHPEDFVEHERLASAGPTGDVEDDALASLSTERVRSTLEVLTPDQRDVMLLRVIGRLTIDEIADVLGRRPGAVKMLQARAIASIRSKIAEGSVTL
ncbi:MAG TPA: sigma-70 family RNA polymerase sigma factor [Actinomycetota bacterium]|nr:sigma-70 family RNA polymerase sigma factor [Actinomycetota bacterium]